MTTSKMMEGVVFDQDLKALFEKDVKQSITAINDLQNLLAKAPKMIDIALNLTGDNS